MLRRNFLWMMLTAGMLSAGDERSVLAVSGQGKVLLETAIAEIHFGVEVEGKKADDVERSLTTRMNSLLAALKGQSVERIERSSYSIHPEYSNQNPPEIKSYRGRGEITASVAREKAGELIQQALANGANKVNQIDLKASDEAMNQGRQDAITAACAQALQSAQSAFKALSLEMDEVVLVDLNAQPAPPMPWRGNAVSFAAKAAPLELEGAQEVEAQVQLNITFKPVKE